MSLHEIGSHYTYSNVPYDVFLTTHFDFSLNETMGWTRNNFDRLIHLTYGLLLANPIRELYCRVVGMKGFWSYLSPLNLIMATSMLYELIEWAASDVFGGSLGMAYLGTQGDIWDAHKDMALATLGGVIAMTVTLIINTRTQRNFREEWKLSLTAKFNSKG
jgi:putative membrane protein